MSALFTRSGLLKLSLRFCVAGGLLWLVFQRALGSTGGQGLRGLLEAWSPSGRALGGRPSPWLTFAAAVGIIGLGFGLNALRFRGLLFAAGMRGRWGSLLRAYLVGSFFNLVLPGAILGDAYRIVDVKALAGGASKALGMVLLERLLGLSALGCIGLVCLPFLPLEVLSERGLGWLPVLLSGSFLLGTWLLLQPRSNAFLVRSCARFGGLWPAASSSAARALAQAGSMWQQPRVLLQTFGLSLLAQGLLVLSLWVLGQSLLDRVDWYWFPVIIPFATLVSLAPISIGAAGLREYLYVSLFGLVGMGAPSALALSLSIFAATLCWALLGLVLFCLGRGQAVGEARGA